MADRTDAVRSRLVLGLGDLVGVGKPADAALEGFLPLRKTGGRFAGTGNGLHIVNRGFGELLGFCLEAHTAGAGLCALDCAGRLNRIFPFAPPMGGIGTLRHRQSGGRKARQHHQCQDKRRYVSLPEFVHNVTSVPAENWIFGMGQFYLYHHSGNRPYNRE